MDPLNQMRRNFLILGFTGPLRSGCTTSAKFFSEHLSTTIKDYVASNLSQTQNAIEKCYHNISKIRKKLDDSVPLETLDGLAGPFLDDNVIRLSNLRADLEELHINRRLCRTLPSLLNDSFIYISMSDIIIKIVIEYVLKRQPSESDMSHENINSYSEVIKTIKKCNFFIENKCYIHKVNKLLQNRTLTLEGRESARSYLNFFFEYLERISHFKKTLRSSIGNDNYGTIMQNFGDNIRKCADPFGDTKQFSNKKHLFDIAANANMVIKAYRDKNKIEDNSRPTLFAIESFRNPAEVQFFRSRYYEFYLISIVAPHSLRSTRPGYDSQKDKRDMGEDKTFQNLYEQDVSNCVRMSDIAIANWYPESTSGKNNPDTEKIRLNALYTTLLRYYALIRWPGCLKPTPDELFMTLAYLMSLRSSCISRQVGAVIVKNGAIIGGGWNDVAKGQIGCADRCRQDVHLSNDALPIAAKNKDVDELRKMIIMDGKANRAFCFKDIFQRSRGGAVGLLRAM